MIQSPSPPLTHQLIDPFQSSSILSLNPRTFRDSKPSFQSNDLEAIHQHLTSMVLRNPDKHFEEAKLVLDGGSEYLNSMESFEPVMKENENPKKNRPALARKRAKFSMKPDIVSQPSTFVEPTFEMNKYSNPEELFAAYEKFEKAKKELKRQRGEDPNEPIIPTTVRERRPELPRRKTSYQHHVYSSSQPENDTLYSQETLQDVAESQPVHDVQHESVTPSCQSKEKELSGSVTNSENRVAKMFDDLMSSNIAELDANEAVSFLKDHLKIKPVAIKDLQLPNFHDLPKFNLYTSINLTKDKKTLLPGTQALSDNLKLSDKPYNLVSSPTLSKSPFSSISSFGKLLQSVDNKSSDPFTARDTDLFPASASSEIVSEPSTHASKDKQSRVSASKDKNTSAMKDKNISANKDNVPKFHFNFDEDEEVQGNVYASKDNLSELQINVEDDEQGRNMEEMDEEIHGNDEDMVEKLASTIKSNLNVEDIADNHHSEQDMGENQQQVEDATEKVISSIPPEDINESETNCVHSAETDDGSNNVLDASLPVQNPDIVPEQQNEEHPKTSINNRKKTRATKVDLKKKRHSLAEAGSRWTTGVRRSNRIRTKPLEYWKGERLLYARIHDSLPTVVGMKYLSPGKADFTVKSFVGDEYKDLVEWSSLH